MLQERVLPTSLTRGGVYQGVERVLQVQPQAEALPQLRLRRGLGAHALAARLVVHRQQVQVGVQQLDEQHVLGVLVHLRWLSSRCLCVS